MKKILCLLFVLLSLNVFAQKEANNWFFGTGAGVRFQDDGEVSLLTGSPINTNEGCSSISDASGNLLFYTDGRNVWDRNHVLMPNGNYMEGTGLYGDPSSTQSAIIIPQKGNPNIYYVFTVDEPHHQNAEVYPAQFTGIYDAGGGTVPNDDDGFNNGFNYSVVDLSVNGSNGSIGDVISRNAHLITYNPANTEEIKYKCSEKVTALKKNDGTGYWVVTHFINKFYAFEVTAEGVNETPVVTTITPTIPTSGYRRNAIGCLKASPNGKMLAAAHVQNSTVTGSSDENGTVLLYDFNNTTGIVSNPVVISQNTMPYGVEFSQKSQKLYVSYDNSSTSAFGGVHQYNLLSADIPASDILVGTTSQSGTLQLAPNGKIYRAVVDSNVLDVINAPDENGNLCDFVNGALFLGQGRSFFGLPPFITSFFSVNILASGKCFGDSTLFTVNVNEPFTSVTWNFGDGNTAPATGLATTTHTYTAPGLYTVVATLTYLGDTYSVTTDIVITPIPVANTPQALRECDPNNDGTAAFDLTQNTALILGTQDSSVYNVKYFASQSNAENNVMELNAGSYTNHTSPETIYARVQSGANPECYQITSFLISTIDSPAVNALEQEIICLNNPAVRLTAMNRNQNSYTYLWSTGETTPSIVVNAQGAYIVDITNQQGCSNKKTFMVTPSDLAIIEDIIVNDLRENNTVTVIASPPPGVPTGYVYSLDRPNGPYQESNIFEHVTSGNHTVYVSDAKGCGIVAREITVLAIPKFFSPNGDGENDYWNIIGVNAFFYPNSKIHIFDRYGKLIADIDPKGAGWDGYANGHRMPATDYWYVVELDNVRTVRGHFSLIR